MEDSEIISLYFARSQQAISETDKKYGAYCYQIAYRILSNREDSEERVNDTYMAAWNRIPPTKPRILAAYLGKITRHLALDSWRKLHADKRGSGEVNLALDELEECIGTADSPEAEIDRKELREALSRFLDGLNAQERMIFVSRYWYLRSVQELSEQTGLSQSNIKTTLFRTRGKLRQFLCEEGFF